MKLKNYIIFLVVLCILFTIGIYLYQTLKPMRVLVSPVGFASSNMESILSYLSKYYEENNRSGEKIQAYDMVKFLENKCGGFSANIFSKKPDKYYNSKYDFGVFLVLPEELNSEAPTIIAYTTPLEKGKRIYRVTLLLNKTDITIIPIENYFFEKAIGIDKLNTLPIPDFYHCRNAKKQK